MALEVDVQQRNEYSITDGGKEISGGIEHLEVAGDVNKSAPR